ncbi:MAG TPA: hypothetical protein DD001_02095 [Microcoleaceae bacterium UBA10368]|jgi:hypothetical protein|nr:hypothetical protein [Microcoleaceae cyanobacterium UBA10368]HCV29244.1 hypothetical protein [Microcoleaceae cyanobacterium UBA9251]
MSSFINCLSNAELTIERDAEGRLIVMSPVGGDSGIREMDIAFFKYVRSPLQFSNSSILQFFNLKSINSP